MERGRETETETKTEAETERQREEIGSDLPDESKRLVVARCGHVVTDLGEEPAKLGELCNEISRRSRHAECGRDQVRVGRRVVCNGRPANALERVHNFAQEGLLGDLEVGWEYTRTCVRMGTPCMRAGAKTRTHCLGT